jgi:hypothetical protein
MKPRFRHGLQCILSLMLLGATASSQMLVNSVVWDITNGGNGRRYDVYLATGPISWTAARSLALALVPGVTDLATPSSGGENAFIFGLCSGLPAVWSPSTFGTGAVGPWIGGRNNGSGWTWVDGEPFCYVNWGLGEPNNGCIGIPLENAIHFSGPVGWPLGSITNFWNDLPAAGCASSGMFPVAYIVEYTSFDTTITQTPLGVTLTTGVGPPGALYLHAIVVTAVGFGDACLDGWFYGVNPTLPGLVGLVTGGPLTFGTLPLSGSIAFFLPAPGGIGAVQLDYVGVLFSPAGAPLIAGRAKTLVTF